MCEHYCQSVFPPGLFVSSVLKKQHWRLNVLQGNAFDEKKSLILSHIDFSETSSLSL